jgi:hypothetical protein
MVTSFVMTKLVTMFLKLRSAPFRRGVVGSLSCQRQDACSIRSEGALTTMWKGSLASLLLFVSDVRDLRILVLPL